MKTERIRQIEQYINEKDVVTIPELLDYFKVSINTIRRDLNELEQEGKIEKIYGGAKKKDSDERPPEGLIGYTERIVKNQEVKYRIAEKASSYISEEDTIFIDTGTSTVPLLQTLSSFHHLTIITNSIYVLYSALDMPQFTVIGLPGVIKNKTASLVGDPCLEMIDRYNIGKAFMACSAFSITGGVSNSSIEEFEIKRKILRRCSQSFLLVDSSKFNRTAMMTFARPEDFDYIITEEKPADEYLKYFESHRIGLVLAD